MYQACQGFVRVNKEFLIKKDKKDNLIKSHFTTKLVFSILNIYIKYFIKRLA